MKKIKSISAVWALSLFCAAVFAVSVLAFPLSASALGENVSDWKAYNASSSTVTNIAETENGIHVTGTVGVAMNETSHVILQSKPLNMNTVVAFDFSINYDYENVNGNRWFAIVFNENEITDGVIENLSDMTLSTPGVFGNKNGLQFSLRRDEGWITNPRFGYTALNNYNGYVKESAAESEFWEKLIAGESVHFEVRRDEKKGVYIVQAEDIVYESPITQIGDGRDYKDGHAYLGFMLYNSAPHTYKLDYKVENLVNGYIGETLIKHNGETVSQPITLEKGKTAALTAELTKSTSAEIPDTSIEWTSDNPAVATVSEDGTVTAVKGGNAVIRATNAEGTFSEIEIVVPVQSMTIKSGATSLQVGKTLSLGADVVPADSAVRYRSLNPEVAEVDASGVVTGKRSGRAVVEISCGQFCETVELEVILDSISSDGLLNPAEETGGAFSVQKITDGKEKYIITGIGAAFAAGGVAGIALLLVLGNRKNKKE